MTTQWRTLVDRLTDAVVIDITQYEKELDSIDASIRASHTAYGGAGLMSPFGWGDPVVRDGTVVKVEKRPVVPLRAGDSARIAVAVLQRLLLTRKSLWVSNAPADEAGTIFVLLAMADRLLSRKLALTTATACDLILLANAPHEAEGKPRSYEYLSAILKQIERSFSPPVPVKMRKPLEALLGSLSTPIPAPAWKHKRDGTASISKRHRNACDHIVKLLN